MSACLGTLSQAVTCACWSMAQAEKVDTLPNGRQLTYGEYRDVGRPLRRMLKQLGAGSLDKGLLAVRSSEAALQEVSQLVHVEPAVSMPCWLHATAGVACGRL